MLNKAEKLSLNSFNKVKSFTIKKNEIGTFMMLLKDKRLLVSTYNSINIYEPSNDYENQICIKPNEVKGVIELENNKLFVCTNKSFMIFNISKYTYNLDKLIKFDEYENKLIKIKNLLNNKFCFFAECVPKVHIWNGESPYNQINTIEIKEDQLRINDVLQIKGKEIVYILSRKCIYVWNMVTNSFEKSILLSKDSFINNLLELDNNKVVVYGDDIQIIDLSTNTIEYNISDIVLNKIQSMIQLRSGYLLGVNYSGFFFLFDFNNNTIQKKKKISENLDKVISINENTIGCLYSKNQIDIWNY